MRYAGCSWRDCLPLFTVAMQSCVETRRQWMGRGWLGEGVWRGLEGACLLVCGYGAYQRGCQLQVGVWLEGIVGVILWLFDARLLSTAGPYLS
ncbi:hypothetical protein AB1N83_013010 [Pleurotus pulmonarius]